jgi:gas vesicle protein
MLNDREQRDGGATSGQVVASVVIGAAVGATLGLIFAPRPGRDTRRLISESGERVRQQASNAYQQASSGVNDIVSRGRAAVARGREAFVSARDSAADQMPRRVDSAFDEGRSDF